MRLSIHVKFFLTLFLVMGCVSGCVPSTTQINNVTSTEIPTIPKSTVVSTLTQSTTPAPIRKSSSQNTPVPPVPIFVALQNSHGDGGEPADGYFIAPSLVIFADGRTIFLDGDYPKFRFKEVKLSTKEMCSILEKVAQTGIFNLNLSDLEFLPREESPIYQFDQKPLVSMGAGGYYFVVNGSPSERPYIKINVYGPYEKHLVREVSQTAEILKGFQHLQKMNYLPERLLLFIEKVNGLTLDNITPHTWAAQLPSLLALINGQDENQVLIENDLVLPIEKMFDYQLTDLYFNEGDALYHVVARPLLPYETPENFQDMTYRAPVIELPFKCNK